MNIEDLTPLREAFQKLPKEDLYINYDSLTGTLYVNLGQNTLTDNSELLDDGTIIRYKEGRAVGFTFIGVREKVIEKAE